MLALIMCSALLDKRCLQSGQAHRRFLGSAPPPAAQQCCVTPCLQASTGRGWHRRVTPGLQASTG